MTGVGAAALFLAVLSQASVPPPPAADSARGAALRVYLLTFDPGARSWERFGHNALWIHDPVAGTDRAYDYGRFAFDEGFVRRFARGDLRYWMGAGDVRAYLAAYAGDGRRIRRQELALEPAARLALQQFLEWNLREENRYYDYDYYLDNCSTRIRDAIDRFTGGAVRRHGDSLASALTYRQQTRRLTENNPFLYAALMIGLGRPVDRPVSAWEAMFLPIELRPALQGVRVPDGAGGLRPLVAEEEIVVESDRFPVPERPSSWLRWFLLAGIAGGLGLAAAGWRGARRALLVAGTAWAAAAGLAGALLAYLWALTDHRFSVANENVLQFSLVSLALAMVLPSALRGRGGIRRLAMGLAVGAAGLSVAGLLLKALPGFTQANAEIIALALPVHLGLLAGIAAISRPARA